MKIDWRKKLTSRKFWIALAGFVVGIVLMFTHNEVLGADINGVIMSLGSVLGYLLAEGLTDMYNKEKENDTEFDEEKP